MGSTPVELLKSVILGAASLDVTSNLTNAIGRTERESQHILGSEVC